MTSPPLSDPFVDLKVAGIVRPTGLSSSFWQIDPTLARPSLEGGNSPNSAYWLGGMFIGPAGVSALPIAYQGTNELVSWFVPMRTDLTAAEVPNLETAVNTFGGSPEPRDAEDRLGAGDLNDTAVSSGLALGLSGFTDQWHTVERSDSLLLVGLFVAGALLLFICSELAADAYRPELVVIRVRGGSLRQLSGRMLARTVLVMLPALVIGAAVAIALLPASDSKTSWLLGGLTAAVALGSLPVIAIIAHRQRRLADTTRQDEAATGRPRWRRLIAELLVVIVAAAAVADLRLRGSPTSTTSAYLSASAVLVAAAVGLIVNRVLPGAAARVRAAGRGGQGPGRCRGPRPGRASAGRLGRTRLRLDADADPGRVQRDGPDGGLGRPGRRVLGPGRRRREYRRSRPDRGQADRRHCGSAEGDQRGPRGPARHLGLYGHEPGPADGQRAHRQPLQPAARHRRGDPAVVCEGGRRLAVA